ncbi:MAG: VacJ family lipoprotein [Thermodesulfobacteriota bacterium]
MAIVLAGMSPFSTVAADTPGMAAGFSSNLTVADDQGQTTAAAVDDGSDFAESAGDDEFSDFDEFEKAVGEEVFDPLAGYNRVMTTVNDRLYYWVLKPIARGYKFVLPEPIRVSIGRFFVNLGFPVRLVNNLLQFKLQRAGAETARFVVNTTAGIAGFWDPASNWMDLPVYDEDFGQTLGNFGMGGGFHVVLPLFGPSNVRDACGKVADWFLNPVHYIEDSEARAAITTVNMVNGTSLRIGQYEALTQDSLDLYILLRDSYESNRNKNIRE